MKYELNNIYNIDCMEAMKEFPDNYFDLALPDPPYTDDNSILLKLGKKDRTRKHNDFIKIVPDQRYFDELQRISKNQIVFGGNYFSDKLPISRGWIFWDKNNGASTFADGELIWTSFDRNLKKILINWKGYDSLREDTKGKIHPTQKPVALYRWLLQNYAKPGNKIVDTHVGSASSMIACLEEGFEYIGFELDEDYFNATQDRIETHKEQGKLFL